MAEKTTFPRFLSYLVKLQTNLLPNELRTLKRDIVFTVAREAAENINGRVMSKTGPNAALARYALEKMTGNIVEDGSTTRTGLVDEQVPVTGAPTMYSEPMSRILNFRENGGTITAKDKQLRIPLEPALTGNKFDRYAGIDLKSRIGTTDNPLELIVSKSKRAFLGIRESKPSSKKPQKKYETPGLWYILARSVSIGAFPNFKNAVEATNAKVPTMLETFVARMEASRGM